MRAKSKSRENKGAIKEKTKTRVNRRDDNGTTVKLGREYRVQIREHYESRAGLKNNYRSKQVKMRAKFN